MVESSRIEVEYKEKVASLEMELATFVAVQKADEAELETTLK